MLSQITCFQLVEVPSLRVTETAVAREAHLAAKFLVRSSDATLTAEEIPLGYKQLLPVERGWRNMKTLKLRPVYHRKEERIRTRIMLCLLALLLIRVAKNSVGTPLTGPVSRGPDNRTQDTLRNLRHELQRMCDHPLMVARETLTSNSR